MISADETWTRIDATAERLGVTYAARRKWFQRRSVPHRWRLPIITASGGTVTAHDFEFPPATSSPPATSPGANAEGLSSRVVVASDSAAGVIEGAR